MSNKYLHVTFSDGNTYRIRAELIASQRAVYYARHDIEIDGGSVDKLKTQYDKILNEEFDYTMAHDSELLDWAANNMDWNSVKEVAVLIKQKTKQPNYNKEWTNANMKIVKSND